MGEVHLLGNCRVCGYALLKLPENRCPECGTPFDPADRTTMDFGRAKWVRFLAAPTTWRTYLPCYPLVAIFAAVALWPGQIWLQFLLPPAILAALAALWLTAARRRLKRRLARYAHERQQR